MTGGRVATRRTPFFLDHSGRRLFAIHYAPDNAVAPAGEVVLFAPFAEEMNCARRMMTLLAETLAGRGFGVLVFDYFGTGDSEGEFAGAHWDSWIEDGRAAIGWATARTGGKVTVLGLRLGAAIALAAARQRPGDIGRAVLWQPVVSGAVYLTQFLRLRIAAALIGAGGEETTRSLRTRLAAGETLEIAGYALAPALAEAIETLRLSATPPPDALPIDWIELGDADNDVAPASGTVIDSWRRAGVRLRATTAPGEPFWAIQETTTAPALIAATAARLAAPPP